MITARGIVRRIEVWNKLKCAGGAVQTSIPDYIDCVAQIGLHQDRLVVSFPIASQAAPFATARKVIRVVQTESVWDEWRIVDRQTDRALGIITVACTSLRSTDVSEGALVSRTDSDGVVNFDFESVGLTPTEHINTWVLPALAAAGFTWITLGTITPTARLDLAFSWDTPLTVLLRLAEATQTELDIRRNGITGYLIDLVTRVNDDAVQADIRFDKNLVNISRDEDTIEMATRVFPRGAQDSDGNHATMARAEWEVGTVASPFVSLLDPAGGAGPIQFDDQLNGAYLRKVDGTLVQVIDTWVLDPAQTVELASVTGIASGDLIQFRADSAGTDLTSLTNPVTIAPSAYGEKVGIVDLPGVSGAKNVVPNSFQRDWPSGDLPVGWTAVGAPTITKQTAAPYAGVSGASIKVVSDFGQGVMSPAGAVFPTEANPFGSGFVSVWVAVGQVRVELLITTPSGPRVYPLPAEAIASSTVKGQWELLGPSGADLYAMGATAVAVRVVQNGTVASTFYVDAAQATETTDQHPLTEGSGGTRLWQAANELLRTNSIPIVSYTVPLVDLEAMDSAVWAESALVVGGPVRIRDDVLALDLSSRILEVNPRDYTHPERTAIVISNKPDDVVDRLAAKPTPRRRLIPPPPPFNPIPNIPEPGSGIPGLVCDLDPHGLVTSRTTGSTTGFCPDVSSNANHATQDDPAKYLTYRSKVINGRGVLESNNSTDPVLWTPAFLNFSLGSTLFLVGRRHGAIEEHGIIVQLGGPAQSAAQSMIGHYGGGAVDGGVRWYVNQAGSRHVLGDPGTDWYILALRIASESSITPYFNGVADTAYDPHNSINDTRGIGIGGGVNGQIARVRAFNYVMTDAEALEAIAALNAIYDIY